MITDDSRHGGIEVASIKNKGRGIKALKSFNKGDFVVEYAGHLIDMTLSVKKDSIILLNIMGFLLRILCL